ncbi:unnamed protein product, partial [Tetraodon nigroviridis]
VYQPGDNFSKRDLFPSKQSNQCALCTCSNGNIFCALKTCQPVTCSSPLSVPDTCCLVCKGRPTPASWASATARADRGTGGFSSAEDGNLQLNRGVRHSVDQCSAEQNRARPDHLTPTRSRASPRGLRLSKLNLKGASETTVKILLQRKHLRGSAENPVQAFGFGARCPVLRPVPLLPACFYNGRTYSHGDVWHPVLGKLLECILCTCNDGHQDCKRITCPAQYPCQYPLKSAGKCCKTCPESKAEANQTQCYPGSKNNLLVYKVESSLRVDPPNTLMEIGDVQKKDIVDHPENYSLLTTLDEGLSQDALWPPIPPRKQPCDHCFLCFRVVEEVQRGGRTPGKGLSGCHL